MRVADTGAESKPPEPPSAEIVGLQFGLAIAKEFLGFSVLERRCKDSIKTLVDPRLGLPAEDGKCATCGGTNYEECAGHFAHVKLSQPIFHPNHTRLLQRILQKVCLACGVPKVKKKKITFSEEADHWKQSSGDFVPEEVNGGREHPVILEAEPIEKFGAGDHDVIEISSDDDDDEIAGILRVALAVPYEPMDFRVGPGSTSQSPAMALPRLGSDKSKGKAHANGSSHLEVAANGSKKSAIGAKKSASLKSQFTESPGKSSAKIYKGRPAGLDVLETDTLKTATSSRSTTCVHCSPGYPEYRPILVKILPMKGRKKDDNFEILLLEVQASKKEEDGWLPDDFWAFLGGPAHLKDKESKVPVKHVLSPSEALSILKKIPERAIGKLGMNRLVARPEGLIMKYVPIPPNCTRTADYKYVNNTTAVRFGSDKVTRALQNLVSEILHIHKTRLGKAMNKAQRDESTALQILTAEYLREKGAPQAVSGVEPLKKDRNGRVTKQDYHRWTKEWLSKNLLAKDGNYTAKAVIVGDPSLSIEEIGVPWVIAEKLTIPERATRWNCTKLQEYVNRSQAQETGPGKPGAARIERNGEAFQVFPNTPHKVEIGDVIHRNIRDGDYVYVNRPPTVHKHSLMALKVHIHYGLVMTVNPLVCPPFSADFDGDAFHIYVPQSLQAIAEVEQLMAVPQQLVSDHGGQPLLGLTQDTLLAAHLLTTSKLFVDKSSMDQLCLWSSKQPPEAAILKSPKGGPFWTGEQIFGLTLPAQLNMGSPDESILIQGGQITKWIEGTNLLRKDKESIASALRLQLGPQMLLDYLNNATGLLHAWLQVQGFSAGLIDFQVTGNSAARRKMLQSILEEYYQKSILESCNSVRILGPEAHEAMGPAMVLNPDSLTKNIRVLEHAAEQIFRTRESDAERIVVKYAEKGNPLLLMVKSGSKGSRGKLLQQIAGMGLQLYKGKHLLPLSGLRRCPSMSDDPLLDWWKDRGLVRSSLVDGLKATELFNHVVADRTGIIRKHIEVTQPGILFKSLMLFLRDLHVTYDGSVRSQCGKNIVQFCYGGAEGVPGRSGAWEEDDHKRWLLSRLSGEPVGVLAATAISQPAYEVMLDAPNLNGPFNPRPLELLQETLYPREKSDLKPIDRYVIIRLVQCLCTKPCTCQEKKVLDVQACLTKVTLRTLAESSAIQFWNMQDTRLAGPSGEALRLGSPWLGHIKLSRDMMRQQKVTIEDIVQRLSEKFSACIKSPKRHPMGQIFFCSSLNCSISNGRCLHFSPKLPKRLENEQDDDIYNEALSTLLMKIRATIIPGLLDSTVKGDERLESVRIVREGPTRTTWHNNLLPTRRNDLEEELVLEIAVSPTKSKSNRSMAWTSVKEACILTKCMNLVDWNRSMPYSIQEIRHALGIETAYEMIRRRLRLVLEKTAPHTHHEHETLIADTMTFSGDANGFTIYGFQDMIKSTAVSAPFTEASFQKPIRTLLDAAGRGATDSVESVMTNCVWGNEAPLGTGSSFDVFWQPSKERRRVATSIEAERDVHAILKDLDGKCIPDNIIPLSPTHSLPGLRILPGDPDLDDGAGFSPQHAPNGNGEDDMWGSSNQNNNGDDGTWGSSPVIRENGGGWGDVCKASDGNDSGGWDQDELGTDSVKKQGKVEEQGAWGEGNSSTWGTGPVQETGVGGWSSVSTEVAKGDGWDALAESQTASARHCASEHTGHDSGRCRGREGNEKDWGSRRSMSVSGFHSTPPVVQRQSGTSESDPRIAWDSGLPQEQNVREKSSWGDSQSQTQDEIAQSSGWDDVPTSTTTPAERDGKRSEPDSDCPNALAQPSDQEDESDVDWGELISGIKKADALVTNDWASSAVSQSNVSAADGRDTLLPENQVVGIWPSPTHPSVGARSHTLRQQETEPECKEIDDLVKSMRRILFNNSRKYEIGGTRLSDKDDEAVKAVLAYHPNFKEKAGCGVAYIKVDKSQHYLDSNCYWLARTDGSETEFSYHKCLKEKVSREFPAFSPDWYNNLYKSRRSGLAPSASLAGEGRHADQREDKVSQADQVSAPTIVVDISSEPICKDLTGLSIDLQPS